MNYGAIILAAGKGERFKGKKQCFMLDGIELWKHVKEKALQLIPAENIVVVGIDIAGGSTRSESVQIGLNALGNQVQRIVILEAARPLVTTEQIRTLLEDTAESTTFVMPLVNTVIYRNGDYINRNELYEVLTPQAFSYDKLKEAYNTGEYCDTTDETVIMFKHYNIRPHFIETGENLIKVTYQRDIPIIETLYKKEKEQK